MNEGGHSDDSNSQKHEVLGHRHKLGSVTNTQIISFYEQWLMTPNINSKYIKVRVKSILRNVINARNALLKHVTKTVNYVVLNCGGRPVELNSFSHFRDFVGGAKSWLGSAPNTIRGVFTWSSAADRSVCAIRVQWELQRADASDITWCHTLIVLQRCFT